MDNVPVALIGSKFPKAAIPVIAAARASIRVLVYDWRMYPTIAGAPVSQFNDAIFSAARRGVSVRALVNSDATRDALRAQKCDAKRLHSKKMLHTKMLLVDDVHLFIGSHNYTRHGFEMNEEASVYVVLPEASNEFSAYFDRLWSV